MANPERSEIGVTIGGAEYTLRFSTNAIVALETETGERAIPFMKRFADQDVGIADVRVIVWAGLLDHQPDTTLEAAGAVIDAARHEGVSLVEPVMEAFGLALVEMTVENPPRPARSRRTKTTIAGRGSSPRGRGRPRPRPVLAPDAARDRAGSDGAAAAGASGVWAGDESGLARGGVPAGEAAAVADDGAAADRGRSGVAGATPTHAGGAAARGGAADGDLREPVLRTLDHGDDHRSIARRALGEYREVRDGHGQGGQTHGPHPAVVRQVWEPGDGGRAVALGRPDGTAGGRRGARREILPQL